LIWVKKYNGDFPPLLSENVKSNFNYYGKLIKEVCKKAELNDDVKTLQYKSGKNDSDYTHKKKWELVSSHIGHRSFATNYYGKIPTALIQSLTGHLSEASFLLYIDKNRVVDLDDLRNQMMNAMK
jgi:hypothetical protein